MRVSVIVPARNGGKCLERLFKALRAQTFRPLRLLLVDSSSNDDTLKICRDLGAKVIQVEAQSLDHGGTRNLAASAAKGEILVFMIQDALLKGNTSLENLLILIEICMDLAMIPAGIGGNISKRGEQKIFLL